MGKAKNKRPEDEALDVPPLNETTEPDASPEADTDLEEQTEKPVVESAIVEVPMAAIDEKSYVSSYVEVRFRHGESHMAKALKRLHEGLYQSGEKLANGQHIRNTADALRWLLEKVNFSSPQQT